MINLKPDLGAYKLIKPLKTGGMSQIYLAKKNLPLDLKKRVIIKLINKKYLQHKELNDLKDMFLQEAYIHHQLQHPNIVQFLDFGFDQHQFFLVLEYVPGVDFTLFIQMLKQKRPEERLRLGLLIGLHILSALEYLHSKKANGRSLNLIHGDISPSNILIANYGVAKLCDFGLTKSVFHNPASPPSFDGKIFYMSPEKAALLPLDHRSDLFNVGLCLFEILTLKGLFTTIAYEKILKALQSGSYLPNVHNLKSLDADLAILMLKALAPSPSDRFSSAREFWLSIKKIMLKLETKNDPIFLQDVFNQKEKKLSVRTNGIKRFPQKNPTPKPWAQLLSAIFLSPAFFILIISWLFQKTALILFKKRSLNVER